MFNMFIQNVTQSEKKALVMQNKLGAFKQLLTYYSAVFERILITFDL